MTASVRPLNERRILTVVATRLVEPWFECGLGVAGASRAGGAGRPRRCRARRRDSGWWLALGVAVVGAAQGPGPPLRPPGRCASLVRLPVRAALDPGDLC